MLNLNTVSDTKISTWDLSEDTYPLYLIILFLKGQVITVLDSLSINAVILLCQPRSSRETEHLQSYYTYIKNHMNIHIYTYKRGLNKVTI